MSTAPRPKYTYDGLLSHLAGGRNKKDRPTDKGSRRIVLTYEGLPAVQLYSTEVATYRRDGSIEIRCGGWQISSVTRKTIGEITGTNIFSVPYHMRRTYTEHTRIYVPGLRFGVPFEDGCVVKNGACIWHPRMGAEGLTDIRDMTEIINVPNEEKAATYYAARRAFIKRAKPYLHFIDADMLQKGESRTQSAYWRTEWFVDLIETPPDSEEFVDCLVALVRAGYAESRAAYRNWNREPDTVSTDDVKHFFTKGIQTCAGPSSWRVLEHLNALDEVRIKCSDA